MADLQSHPTVLKMRGAGSAGATPRAPLKLDAADLREICLAAGADDCGFVNIDDPAIDDQRALIVKAYPFAKTLIALVVRMNKENVRSSARSFSNLEFHETGDEVTAAARVIARELECKGARAGNANMAFPMEMDGWPGRIWVVSHKPVAVAAGLGQMGIHRNVIHPKFGNFILLGTVVTDCEVERYSKAIDYNPCLECKLCVAACPTGAISPDGHFNFAACYTHNYREFMGGFSEWIETIADARGARELRAKVTDQETVSMWQSLAYGPNYKAAYCLAVCPAGEDVIGPYLTSRKDHVETIVKPLQEKVETVYVQPGSDAERYVSRRYPHKPTKKVSGGFRLHTIEQFLNGLPLTFQRGQAGALDAVYHFVFTGREPAEATIVIRNKTISVKRGLINKPDLRVTADSASWLAVMRKERSMPWAIVRRDVRLKGPLKLLQAFGACFPI